MVSEADGKTWIVTPFLHRHDGEEKKSQSSEVLSSLVVDVIGNYQTATWRERVTEKYRRARVIGGAWGELRCMNRDLRAAV